jgi:hypothetical protein
MIEPPREGDGAIAGVVYMGCVSETPEGPVGYLEACEQQDAGATCSVVDIALAGLGARQVSREDRSCCGERLVRPLTHPVGERPRFRLHTEGLR